MTYYDYVLSCFLRIGGFMEVLDCPKPRKRHFRCDSIKPYTFDVYFYNSHLKVSIRQEVDKRFNTLILEKEYLYMELVSYSRSRHALIHHILTSELMSFVSNSLDNTFSKLPNT